MRRRAVLPLLALAPARGVDHRRAIADDESTVIVHALRVARR